MKSNEIIFLNDIKNVNKFISKKSALFLAFDEHTKKILKKKGLRCKSLDNYSSDFSKKTIRWIKDFPNQKINGKNLKEHFVYDNVSLWWMFEFYLFSSSVFYPGWQEIIIKLEQVKKAIQVEKPKKIIYLDDGSDYSKIISKICKELRIDKHVIKLNSDKIRPWAKRNGIISYKILRNLARKCYWSMISIFDNKKKGKKKVLICTESQWGMIREGGKEVVDDIRFHNILKSLEQNNLGAILVDNPIGQGMRIEHFRKRIGKYARCPPIEKYISFLDFFDCLIEKRKINRKYKKIKKDIKYVYGGVDLKDLFSKKMDFLFSKYCYETLLFFKAYERAIRKENPSIMGISSEINPPQRIAIAMGHKHGLKSVSIQHGAMGYMSDFVFDKKDIKKGDSSAPYLPLPDVQCVYGEFHKKFLIDNSKYSNNQVVVTGNPKYDIIYEESNKIDKDSIKREMGVKDGKKVVLFFSVPFNDYNYSIKFAEKIYEGLSQLNGVFLIIKMHPNEFNRDIHNKMIKKYGIKDVIISEESNIFELGLCADVIVTGNSSTVMDMAAIKKPVVMFDPSKIDKHCKEYENYNAGILTFDSKNLRNKIQKILQNTKFSSRILKNQERFIKAYMYRLDGEASRRIAEVMRKEIKK